MFVKNNPFKLGNKKSSLLGDNSRFPQGINSLQTGDHSYSGYWTGYYLVSIPLKALIPFKQKR